MAMRPAGQTSKARIEHVPRGVDPHSTRTPQSEFTKKNTKLMKAEKIR